MTELAGPPDERRPGLRCELSFQPTSELLSRDSVQMAPRCLAECLDGRSDYYYVIGQDVQTVRERGARIVRVYEMSGGVLARDAGSEADRRNERARHQVVRRSRRDYPTQAHLFAPLAGEEMDAVVEAHPVAAHAHDQRMRSRRVGEGTAPRRRSPFVTPVATTITSPLARSSWVKTRVTSSTPTSRADSICERLVGQSCATDPPPRQRSAAADSTA